jgi:hypothetical protein
VDNPDPAGRAKPRSNRLDDRSFLSVKLAIYTLVNILSGYILMRTFAFLSSLAVAASLFAMPAFATSWEFDLVNRSNANILNFKTREGGSWSRNWLNEIVVPGETFVMDFGTNEGNCGVRTRMEFSDGTFFEDTIDYCSMSTITVRINDVVWD